MTNPPQIINDGLQSTMAELGTLRDKAASLTYVETQYDDAQLVAAYRTSWLARKIVDVPALDTFRQWRSWQAEEPQIEKIEEEEKRLGLQAKMLRAATLARLYGECSIYFDLGDDPAQPVNPERVRRGGIRFCTILTHAQIAVGGIDQEPLSPNFGKPEWYEVVGTGRGTTRIHPSRLIALAGVPRPEELIFAARYGATRRGDSVLYALMQAVQQFDSTSLNIASLIFEAKVDVIKVKGLTTHVAGNPREEAKLLDRYRLAAMAKGNNGMLILDGDNEEYEQKSASFSALPDIMDRFAQNSAGGADIPMTRLFGRSPGGMNSTGESDLRNYYDRISSTQELDIRPAMEVFDECLLRSALGSRPPEAHYKWGSLWQITDKERADLGRINVTTIKTLKDTGLIPDEVLSLGAVNLLTQDGIIPGLEAEYSKYFAEGGEAPWDAEPPEGEDQAVQVQDEASSQPRAPKGTPNGGQWVKSGSGSGGGVSAAAAKVATAKYSADKVQALTSKDPKTLSHYEKKVLSKYKKALQEEKAKAPAAAKAPEVPDMVGYFSQGMEVDSSGKVVPKKPAPVDVDPLEGVDLDFEPLDEPTPPSSAKAPDMVGYLSQGMEVNSAGKVVPKPKAPTTAKPEVGKDLPGFGVMTSKEASAHIEDKYGYPNIADFKGSTAAQMAVMSPNAKTMAAEYAYHSGDADLLQAIYEVSPTSVIMAPPTSVAASSLQAQLEAAKGQTAATPAAPASAVAAPTVAGTSASAAKSAALQAVATAQYPASKIEALTTKDPKTLSQYEKKKLSAYKKALQAEQAKVPKPAPTATPKAVDPKSAEAMKVFAEIGKQHYGMSPDTVQKLATGEWSPDVSKSWQNAAKVKAQEYLKTGTLPKPAAVVSSSGSTWVDLAANLNAPPPISNAKLPQTALAKVTQLTSSEHASLQKYTGSTYQAINGSLRKGGTHSLVPAIDAAMAKSSAITDMTLVRGVSSHGMQAWLAASGGKIEVGAVIKDLGYVSTTRVASVATAFAGGGSGFGLKITVPKGSRIVPLKSLSHYAHEDEFLLPRGSSFKVTSYDAHTKVIHVEVVNG